MGLTSEQVHWLGGGAFVLVALALIARETGVVRGGGWRWLLPVLLVGYGIESFVDVWVHGDAAPASYGAESQQHWVQGGAVLLAGLVEGMRLRGRLARPEARAQLLRGEHRRMAASPEAASRCEAIPRACPDVACCTSGGITTASTARAGPPSTAMRSSPAPTSTLCSA